MAFNPLAYLKESRTELNKVVWPSRQETVRMTVVVIVVSLLIGIYIAGLDTLFTSLVSRFITK